MAEVVAKVKRIARVVMSRNRLGFRRGNRLGKEKKLTCKMMSFLLF